MCAHAKDSLITPNKMTAYMTEVAAGQGVMDYETYLVGFSRLKDPRTLLIEHLPDDQYAGAKKFIEDTAAKVGVKFYA
jgi:L-ribulose-5-phosphate 3-epimerase UlaE